MSTDRVGGDTSPAPRVRRARELAQEHYSKMDSFESMSELDRERVRQKVEARMLSELNAQPDTFELMDILPYITEGVELCVEDDFTKCFQSSVNEPWNWNFYLFIFWSIGVVVRFVILLPIRLVLFVGSWLIFAISFISVKFIFSGNTVARQAWERRLIRFLASGFVGSWTGVIKYHGVIPARLPNQIYVSNHTSLIDYIILQQMNIFSAVGQKHEGWVGFLQDSLLGCLGCIWFDRKAIKDRVATAKKIQEHIASADTNRLLIFPEGTCVNNEYCVQFKKGVFEIPDVIICPIAIKYNKTFVDAFWNSRRRPFHMHLFDLMSSWAVVCDVWYLEPQTRRKNETSIQFADRVKAMICDAARLENVSWDGYMKYLLPSTRFIRAKQERFAAKLKRTLDTPTPNSPVLL